MIGRGVSFADVSIEAGGTHRNHFARCPRDMNDRGQYGLVLEASAAVALVGVEDLHVGVKRLHGRVSLSVDLLDGQAASARWVRGVGAPASRGATER